MVRALLACALLAAGSLAHAASAVKNRQEGRNVEDGTPAAAAPGAAAAAAAQYPEGVPADTTWFDLPRFKDLPERIASHRILRLSMAKTGWAIGFMTHGLSFPSGENRSGIYATAPSPGAKTDSACLKHMWISAKVGGAPIPGCYPGAIDAASPVSITWLVQGRDAPKIKPGVACVLEPGKRYYAHYTATGWDRNDEHKPKHCDNLLNSNLAFVPD